MFQSSNDTFSYRKSLFCTATSVMAHIKIIQWCEFAPKKLYAACRKANSFNTQFDLITTCLVPP